MPTPSSRTTSACSNSSQSIPRARNIKAVVRPPIPPPTMIAFITHTPREEPLASHGPSFRRKRLRSPRFHLRPGLRLSLNFEVLEILPLAHAVADNLLPAWQILRRAKHIRAIPGGGLHGEAWIDQMRAAERHQVGPAGGEDGVDLVGAGDVADAHGGDARFVAHLVRERRLEHAAV